MFGTAMLPAVVENHLDCIDYWEDGRLVLGSSSLTGRYWNGSLWCFHQAEDAPNIEKCVTGTETESGIADALCLRGSRVVVGLDSGALELYQMETDPVVFGNVSYACEHDDIVSSLSLNCSQTHIVSGSYDKCIKVWDIETWRSISTFRPAHAAIVWQVSFSACEPQVFVSCGEDGGIRLWDLRLAKPATVLNKTPVMSTPTAVSWQPQNFTVFAAGDDSGKIFLKDVRGAGDIIAAQGHKRAVFRLSFCPQNPLWLASCADETSVSVLEIGKCGTASLYEDDSHSDFVRGLVWSPDSALVSCGWDKKVLKHNISSCEMEVASPDSRESSCLTDDCTLVPS